MIITADHETGGLTFTNESSMKDGMTVHWSTTGHTGEPVPLFAFGPYAHNFGRKIDNTDIPKIIGSIIGLQEFEAIEN